jgi:hypothetical protein
MTRAIVPEMHIPVFPATDSGVNPAGKSVLKSAG